MRRHFLALKSLVAAVLATLGASAAADDLSEVQIDWVIPSSQFPSEVLEAQKDKEISIALHPVPSKLFVTKSPLVDVDGEALLPRGAQLYRMVGHQLMMCSQSSFEGYLGKGRRICLIDTSSDGQVDSYFTQSRGRDALWSGDFWYAMAGSLPEDVTAIQPTQIAEVDRELATEKPIVNFVLQPQKSGRLDTEVKVDGRTFTNQCMPKKPKPIGDDMWGYACFAPGIVVISPFERRVKGTPWRARIVVQERLFFLRFDVSNGILIGKNLNAVRIF